MIVGAGAAGMMAGTKAAESGLRVLILEKNRKAGVKILMSGGTRCNLTQNTDAKGIIRAYGKPGRFLHSALAAFSPQDVVDFFHGESVPTKVEPTGKIFPVSDRALDVQRSFLRCLDRTGASLRTGLAVSQVSRNEDGSFTIRTESEEFRALFLLLTTGGQSFPGCGTTGDGYAWAKNFGHTIVPPRPALTPLTSSADWVRSLSGITLPDVQAYVIHRDDQHGVEELSTTKLRKRAYANSRGSFLFTHKGLSGPVPMNVSRAVTDSSSPGPFFLIVDFKPDWSESESWEWIDAEVNRDSKKAVINLFHEVLPKRVSKAALEALGVDSGIRCAELGKKRRRLLFELLKRMRIPISGTLGFAKAEVTAGGVSLNEVDSSTLESKCCPGLYLAGEILDLDGPIGGYNFQAAFSTGFLAASKVAARKQAGEL